VQHRALCGLVRRLVDREAHVAVGAEELARAELGREIGHERFERRPHALLVHRLVLGPVGLRVVGLEALVEVERLGRPAFERSHGRARYWLTPERARSPTRTARSPPAAPSTAGSRCGCSATAPRSRAGDTPPPTRRARAGSGRAPCPAGPSPSAARS